MGMKSRDTSWEKRFTNQNWKGALNEIYSHAPALYGVGKSGSYEDDHPLAKRLRIKGYELMLIMIFLEEQSLIEYDKRERSLIFLTSKGFEVALHNQTQSTAFRTNFVLILFTAIIAFATAVDVFVKINDLAVRIVTLAFVIGLGLIFWQGRRKA